jgi:hypothetical protein
VVLSAKSAPGPSHIHSEGLCGGRRSFSTYRLSQPSLWLSNQLLVSQACCLTSDADLVTRDIEGESLVAW